MLNNSYVILTIPVSEAKDVKKILHKLRDRTMSIHYHIKSDSAEEEKSVQEIINMYYGR